MVKWILSIPPSYTELHLKRKKYSIIKTIADTNMLFWPKRRLTCQKNVMFKLENGLERYFSNTYTTQEILTLCDISYAFFLIQYSDQLLCRWLQTLS